MHRRHLLATTAALPLAWLTPLPARAHHGWSNFDQNRPLYLEGTASKVAWRNPHAEVVLAIVPGLKLPADLAQRAVPAQTAPVDSPKLLAAARLPARKDPVWTLEFAPLTRMEAWKVAEIRTGAPLAVIGYAAEGERGDAVMRVEYLFFDGKAYGLRSSPA